MPNVTDIKAPHGRNDDGTPIAPYGFKTDGTPRLSNRGAKPGQKGNGGTATTPKTATKARQNTSDRQRKAMLVELSQNLVVMPLVALSAAPVIVKRVGERQADALALDAAVLDQLAEPFVDGLIQLSQARPGVLSWMDTVEEKAPFLPLMMVGLSMVKAFVSNHSAPDPQQAAQVRNAVLGRAERAQAAAAAEMEEFRRLQEENAAASNSATDSNAFA